jgi:tRNA(Arg) A34 adenosine deaminase TadA
MAESPTWITDYVGAHIQEGLDQALMERFPGADYVMDGLIEMIPRQDYSRLTEFPVAAAVVRWEERENGLRVPKVISQGLNIVNHTNNSFNHAEMAVMQEAMELLGTKHPLDTTTALFTTICPCAMCAAGINNACESEGTTVIYGASQSDMRGRHVKIGERYKLFRTEPESYSVENFLGERNKNIQIIGGYKKDKVLDRMSRHPSSLTEYSKDPDAH